MLGTRVLCLLQENVVSRGQLSPGNALATLIPSSGTTVAISQVRCDASWRRCPTLDLRGHLWGPLADSHSRC